ncbi:hypothetical protein KsCSTR_23990 [Candidatus Kuenenia stuttgartiensis]|uniref:Uncharacterized protein n=1 Tax=Kuenenia stuttgartiensis TaxID=174633 RepID=Q1Q3U4_KUEST|nr:hypothetical protein KsCSTR_23990 [Candidatus Kuenenia stuttgartiensis]CAJ74675.1 unknown protein [Candidatus Kuenenia stuttgartiensis]
MINRIIRMNYCQIFTWRDQTFGKRRVFGRRGIYCHCITFLKPKKLDSNVKINLL